MKAFEEFYEKQPPLLFVDELKAPLHQEKPLWFKRTETEKGETSASGIYIKNNFPDSEGLLETAVSDFSLFAKVFEIDGKDYPVCLEYEETDMFEQYKISVTKEKCIISAGDTEGIRRGIIFIEDELQRREGAILPLGEIVRTPRIKARITRGFFSPTNRPPKNIDELYDDIDYYPEEYLNRIAHDGTNGLWIYTRLPDLVKNDIIPEYGEGSKRRIAKLKKIIARCKRYGIKVYIFFIEPIYLTGKAASNHPELCGYEAYQDIFTFCSHSEQGAKYCIEAMEKLCLLLPDLGGFIDITNGERPSSCASVDTSKCPRCKEYSRAEVVAYTADLLKEGIRRAGTGAEFISWTYGHRLWGHDEIREYVKNCPKDVIVMENFEEMGVESQLGKDRLAVDYWLSYVGPSGLYKAAADAAEEYNKTMYAKMQVCCSHEVATVPYVPVPGILFEKFKANVEGVMQCWYFGNYPSMMSKAAGELSFEHKLDDKNKFLEHLAGIYCGNSHAKKLAAAWSCFEEGYKNYPINIMFSYYGPMHDGVVWELQLEPKNQRLPRTWFCLDSANGDRIYECLQLGHTLEEVTTLLAIMKEKWESGVNILPDECPKEQKTVADAMHMLIKSGNNIMNFYAKREQLEKGLGDSSALLDEMEAIVREEILVSTFMITTCEEDSRLGYHSEAEGYKFFPAQLKKRIKALNNLLETEFKTVRKRLENGEAPFIYKELNVPCYKMAESLLSAKPEPFGKNGAVFKAAYDEKYLYIEFEGKKDNEFSIMFELQASKTTADIYFKSGKMYIKNLYLGLPEARYHEELDKYSVEFESNEKDKYTVKIDREKLGWKSDTPLSFRISGDTLSGDIWSYVKEPFLRLGIYYVPEEFGKLIP